MWMAIVNGRWTESLTPAVAAAYEERSRAELGDACARWLAVGGPVKSSVSPRG